MASKFKREFKNVVYNYSDAEAKVREATSNDPWGPSSALMSELAEYTFHVEAYSLVMGMLWKRLNDHGKNWRHVYKALVVLEYLIKTGSERVWKQCKDNLFSIQTLKDFQYTDKDGKDQGQSIREKAKNLVALLKDESRLKEERQRAMQARDRQGGIGSDGKVSGTPTGTPKSNKKVTINVPDGHVSPDSLKPGQSYIQPVEQARPGDTNEEDMQLKLAIQLSKQQAEEEERLQAQEEESLKAALELSKSECPEGEEPSGTEEDQEQTSNTDNLLLDFSSSGLGDPWSSSNPAEPPPPSYDMITGSNPDPWGTAPAPTATAPPASSGGAFDPWGGLSSTSSVPATAPPQQTGLIDPWATPATSSIGISSAPPSMGMATSAPPPAANTQQKPADSFNPFDLSTLDPSLPAMASTPFNLPQTTVEQPKRVEDDFLGDLAQLVNLDSLSNPNQQPPPKSTFGTTPSNPFGNPTGVTPKSNPFESTKAPAPTLNQLAGSNQKPGFSSQQLPAPLMPSPSGGSPVMSRHQQQPTTNGTASYNPFS